MDVLDEVGALSARTRRTLLIERGQWAVDHPAIHAMARGQIDSYLFNPWTPCERWLYLPMSELLAEWSTAQRPSFEVLQIVGEHYESRAHALRDALSRLMETSLPGVFAVGDVRHRSTKRVASAVGSGAIAVQLVHEYLALR